EDGVGRGTALAPHEGAGDLADGIQALFEIDGKREEVDVPRLRCHAGRHEDDGLAKSDGGGAVGLAGQAAGLDDQGSAGNVGLINTRHLVALSFHFSVSSSSLSSSPNRLRFVAVSRKQET